LKERFGRQACFAGLEAVGEQIHYTLHVFADPSATHRFRILNRCIRCSGNKQLKLAHSVASWRNSYLTAVTLPSLALGQGQYSPVGQLTAPKACRPAILTCEARNAALRSLGCVVFCGVAMNDIVDRVLNSYGRNVSEPTQTKLFNYIALLASAGKTSQELFLFGEAYLREISEPDPRYSGC
jgi:hypothetical protein